MTYFAVYGCLHSSCSNPELSYFKLPADPVRRFKWLRLILRDDLIDKAPHNYTVCEAHFNTLDILVGTKRKKLKLTSLPALHLPEIEKLQNKTKKITQLPTLVDSSSQTDEQVTFEKSVGTQTDTSVLPNTPHKRKLKADLTNGKRLKNKLYDIDKKKDKYQKDILHKLCEKFLTKELADLVKTETQIKLN